MRLNSIYYAFLKRFKQLKRKDFLYYFIILQKIYLLKKKTEKEGNTLKKKEDKENKQKGLKDKEGKNKEETLKGLEKKNLRKKKKKLNKLWRDALIGKELKTEKEGNTKELKTEKEGNTKELKTKKEGNTKELKTEKEGNTKELKTEKEGNTLKKKEDNIIIKINKILNLKKKRKIKLNPYNIFLSSLDNLKPVLVLKARLIRGRLNKIPFIIKRKSDYKQVFSWLKENWNEKKKESYFTKYLLKSIGGIYKTISRLFKNREILYEEVLQNRGSLRFLKKKKKRN